MKTALVILLAAINLATGYIAYENRASEKVLSAFASISVSALAAVFLAVFVFAEQPSIETKFPVAFFVDLERGFPVALFGARYPTIADFSVPSITSIRERYPSSFSSEAAATTYHRLLQRLLLDWMSQVYSFSWMVSRVSYDLPFSEMTMTGPASAPPPCSRTLDTDAIVKLFPIGSPAQAELLRTRPDGSHRIVLPPRTVVSLSTPHQDPSLGEVGEILLETRYCTVIIATRTMGGLGGVGEYAVLGGMNNLMMDKVQALTYELTYSVRFPRWLSGNPSLSAQKAWAEGMLAMLQESFDEQVILRKSREAKIHPKVPPGVRMGAPEPQKQGH